MDKRISLSEISPIMKGTLDNGGEVIFTVTGNSMVPMLRHKRDRVCIEKPAKENLKKYAIPLFVRKDGKYILHRIVAEKPEGYVTAGDNQCFKEYEVEPTQVIGVVKGFWRNGRYISCDNYWYRLYSRLWVLIYPIRWFCVKCKSALGI